MPITHSPIRAGGRPLAALFVASALLAAGPAPAMASASPADSAAAPIGETQTGNYLAALVAGADRDTPAAAIYFREALRADPRNPDLIERAFAAALVDGDVANGFLLADRLIARDPGNSLARLALAVRAIAEGQFVAARAQLSAGEAGKAHDVTTTLLTAWSYAEQYVVAAPEILLRLLKRRVLLRTNSRIMKSMAGSSSRTLKIFLETSGGLMLG